jgi:hypothetical protein
MPDELPAAAPTPASAPPVSPEPALPASGPSATEPGGQSQEPEPEGGAPAAAAPPSLWDQLTKQTVAAAAPAPDVSGQPENAAELAAKKPREARARVLADLAQRESSIAQRDEELKKHEQELADYKAALEGLKTDPLGTLEKAGLTYEQLTLAALKGKKGEAPELTAVREELKAEIKALKDEQAGREQAAARQGYQAQLRAHIDEGGDKYELTRARGDYDKVWDLMVEISRDSGGKTVPTFEQAASFYEIQLRGDKEKEWDLLMKTKHFAAKRGTAPGTPPAGAPPTPAAVGAPKPRAPAVTNALSGASADPNKAKPKTKDDSYAIFKEHMKKAFFPAR